MRFLRRWDGLFTGIIGACEEVSDGVWVNCQIFPCRHGEDFASCRARDRCVI